MTSGNTALSVILVWLFIVVGGAIGWVMNIVKLIHMLGDPTVTPMFVARIVGVIAAPLGAILGWF